MSPKSNLNTYLKAAFIFLWVAIAYFPSTQNGYIWDDDIHSKIAPVFYEQGFFKGLYIIWFDTKTFFQHYPHYYPLIHTTYLIEYHFFGMEPMIYHITNILLHALVSVVLYLLLRRLRLPVAFAAALLFAIHPVHVESVAWISERKNVLSGFFCLLSALLFMRWHDKREEGKNSLFLYFMSWGAFALALMAKTVVATMPFALILILWWKQHTFKKSVLRLTPFMTLAILMGVVAIYLEQEKGGAMGKAWDLSFLERSIIAGKAICFYIGKIIFPHKLTFIYPRWQIDASAVWQYMFPILFFASLYALWKIRFTYGRGPLVAILVFSGTLFPALGFLNVFPMQFSFVADHFQYMASIPLIILLTSSCHSVLKNLDPKLSYILLLVVVVFFAPNTWGLQAKYKNKETLWKNTIERNPGAWIAYGNLGAQYYNDKDYEKAYSYLKRSTEINPKHIIALNNLAQVHLNLFKKLHDQKHLIEAIIVAQQAQKQGQLELAYLKEKYNREKLALEHITTRRILGDIQKEQGDLEGAIKHYKDVLTLNPSNLEGLNRMAGIHIIKKEYKNALVYIERSLKIKERQHETWSNLGVVYYKLGQIERATAAFKTSIQLDTDKKLGIAYYYLGIIETLNQNYKKSIMYFEQAIQLASDNKIVTKSKSELKRLKGLTSN